MRGAALWVFAVLAAAPPAAYADEPTPPVKDQIEAFFGPQFFVPETVDWHYDFSKPFLGGTLWCGKVNFMSSVHQYVGDRAFYVTVFSDGVHQGAIMGGRSDDPAGAIANKLHMLCGF